MEYYDIVEIEEREEEEVWDISFEEDKELFFEKEPNFVANKVVLHNCHAAGIIISNEPLSGLAPMKMSKKGLATQYPYEDLEDMGFKCVGSIQLLEPNYPFKPEDYENPEYLEKYTEEQMAADTITLLKPMPLDGGYLYINLHTIKFINPVSTFGYYIEYYSGRQREGNVNGIEGVKKLEQELDAEFRKEK